MSTYGRTSSSLGIPLPMLGLIMLAGVFGLFILGGGLVDETTHVQASAWEGIRNLGYTGELAGSRWTSHANDGHGKAADMARDWADKYGSTCAYKCGDGRTRFLCLMDNGWYAFVVLGPNGNGITAWTMSKEDAATVLGGDCVPRK